MCENPSQGPSLTNGVGVGLTGGWHQGVGLGKERGRGERVGSIGKSKGAEDNGNSAFLTPSCEALSLVSVFSEVGFGDSPLLWFSPSTLDKHTVLLLLFF